MARKHDYSFFGQNTGLILSTSSQYEPFLFIRCIKRKSDGNWEKYSNGEGKVIKISLEEMVMIIEVLNSKKLNWTSYHTFKDDKTQFSFEWEDKTMKVLWIKIVNYSKMLNFAQVDILKRLLEHVLDEKIEHATVMNNEENNGEEQENYCSKNFQIKKRQHQETIFRGNNEKSNYKIKIENNKPEKDTTKEIVHLNGIIQGETEKAFLINFNSGQETWIPKSTIHGNYSPRKNHEQEFFVEYWILKRNKISLD